MGNEDFGECSYSMDNDEDDEDKPLKKAKYMWQVKGKHHLKTVFKSAELSEESDDEKIALKSTEVPITLVAPSRINEDVVLIKWQARQEARGYIDNAINGVLDSQLPDTDTFNAEDFVDDCTEDSHIENEGIAMAIQSHGLHSSSNTTTDNKRLKLAERTLDRINCVKDRCLEEIVESSRFNKSNDNCTKRCRKYNGPLEFNFFNVAVLTAIEDIGLHSANP